ncbi:MAG: hypothetical protein HYZ71_06820 [Deltaproteobacteria bacterium]|nr:hypothetical protein [Deltaproteobacteria bacterium]
MEIRGKYPRKRTYYLRCVASCFVVAAFGYLSLECLKRTHLTAGALVQPSYRETQEPIQVSAPLSAKAAQLASQSFQKRMSRFDKLRNKVLMSAGEGDERQALFSDLPTIAEVESRLERGSSESLVDRLRMIDFLEAGLSWKENTSHAEIVSAIERIISADNLSGLSTKTKKSLLSDKVELFALLVQEKPHRAQQLFDSSDNVLKEILDYAIKRLSLGKRLQEGELQ